MRTDEELAAEKKRESQRICLDVAQEFFVEQFYADNPESEAARQYAFSRWEEDYCRLAGIGYAPRSSALFLDFIKRKGCSIETMIEVGLVGRNKENGSLYAMLRQRVALPVRSRTKSMTTFSARYIGDNPDIMKRSKYMNLCPHLPLHSVALAKGAERWRIFTEKVARTATPQGNHGAIPIHATHFKRHICGIQLY